MAIIGLRSLFWRSKGGVFPLLAGSIFVGGFQELSSAAVVGSNAVVSTSVQELIDGAPGSVNQDQKEFSGDEADLPLDASADLTSTDLSGTLVSLGQGFGRFADPARLDQPNPEEFAIEVACYSNTDAVSYLVESSAVESRTIVFRSSEVGASPEIQFRADGTRVIESRVFFSGAVLFWTTRPPATMPPMESELRLTIGRSGESEPVFGTVLKMTSQASSEPTPESSGPIRFDLVGLDELEELGADASTVEILRAVADSGSLAIVVIPPQEHAYSYTVRADEQSILTATLEARVRNAPAGTGVAAVLGRPFKNLADFVQWGLPGVNGETLERSINEASTKRALGLVKDDTPARSVSPRPAMCGALGLETVLLSLGLLFTGGRRFNQQASRGL